jgi:hypothetical protein
MKYVILIALQLCAFSAFSQLDLPSWLQADTTGEYVTVNGSISLSRDSLPTDGMITVTKRGKDFGVYQFACDKKGEFKIFLPANAHYSIRFDKEGYIGKTIDVFTTNIPQKVWRNYFALELNGVLQEEPKGFDKAVTMVPMMIAKYDAEVKFFIFDEEFAKVRQEAVQKEIERCKQNL